MRIIKLHFPVEAKFTFRIMTFCGGDGVQTPVKKTRENLNKSYTVSKATESTIDVYYTVGSEFIGMYTRLAL